MDGRRPPTETTDQHVEIEINAAWLESVKYKVDMYLHRRPPAKPAIFRVPISMRYDNQDDSYEPKLVSIGPYHRGKSNLKAMEELKWRLLHHYLSIVPNGSNNESLKNMKNLEKRAREYYSEVIDLDSDHFMEMLLLDGCFLVQTFIAFDDDKQAPVTEELKSLLEENMWFRKAMTRDILLLENQLPYFIIEHLLDTLRIPGWNSSRLQEVAIKLFMNVLPQDSNDIDLQQKQPQQVLEVHHLLHLLHKWIISISVQVRNSSTLNSKVLPYSCDSSLSKKFQKTVPTMTELTEAGVKIKVMREAKSFLDIVFYKDKGELRIPAICIYANTNFFFANLIAFEQCDKSQELNVSHYIFFLNSIINTPRDVALLYQQGIIDRWASDDEGIASLFNKLGKGVIYRSTTGNIKDSYIKHMTTDLNAYCQSTWPKWRAKAVHDYFKNPWALISLGAAALLLALSILQTIFTILGHYKT